MNRRDFLQSLAAMGTSLIIPTAALRNATEPEIETAWQALISEPRTFYVSSCGALSSSFGVDYPTTRASLLALEYPPADIASLADYIESEWRIESHVEYLFDLALDADEAGEATDWLEWLQAADEETLSTVQMSINSWLDGSPDESDWEHAVLHGLSSRGDALQFFRDERETADLLDIVIVEGDHPGSSYYAAELRMDMAEANALAEQHGLPIRFDHDEG